MSKPDADDGDLLAVGGDAANRHDVADVAVGHQRGPLRRGWRRPRAAPASSARAFQRQRTLLFTAEIQSPASPPSTPGAHGRRLARMMSGGSTHVRSRIGSGRSAARIISEQPISGASPSLNTTGRRRTIVSSASRAAALDPRASAPRETRRRTRRQARDVSPQRSRSRRCRRAARTGTRPSADGRLGSRCRAGKYGGLPRTRSNRSSRRRGRTRLAEIAVANLVARLEPVVGRRLARQPDALVLRFDRHDARARQPPGGDHPDRPDARTEVEHRRGTRRPARPVPCRQHIVGREAMAVAKLEDPEVAADRVERFIGRHVRRRRGAGRNRAGFGPALEVSLHSAF